MSMERIELRNEGGPLLGILIGGTALQIKRGLRMFEVDLFGTMAQGMPVIFERMLTPDEPDHEPQEAGARENTLE